MQGRVHLVEDALNPAIGADDEGGPNHAHELLTARTLLEAPDAVLLGDLVIGIGQQRKRKRVLFLEGGLGLDGVRAAPEHESADALETSEIVTDSACFGRSAGGIGAGIEIEDDRLAARV